VIEFRNITKSAVKSMNGVTLTGYWLALRVKVIINMYRKAELSVCSWCCRVQKYTFSGTAGMTFTASAAGSIGGAWKGKGEAAPPLKLL
jgi:hypothetical protein